MLKKLGVYSFIVLLFLSLSGCTVMHLVKAKSYLMSGQYDEAMIECEKALRTNAVRNPLTIVDNGVRVNADYFSAVCLGASYQMTDNFEESAKYWHMSIKLFPEKAYLSYISLAELYYQNGKLEEAYEYSAKAKESVNSPSYHKLASKSVYDADLWRNMVTAANEFYELRLLFRNLEKEFELKNYEKVVQLAKKILSTKYHVHFGINGSGTAVETVSKGSMGDLNGFVRGDKVLEVDGVPVSTEVEFLHEANKLINKYGSSVNFEIERRGRLIPLICKFTYPEIEKTQLILQEAKTKVAVASDVMEGKDTQVPWLKILEPKSARGIKIVAKQNVTFAILSSDNVAVKDVFVNDISCASSEAGTLEKTFLPGNVKKYTVTIPFTQAKNIFAVKAIDASGNVAWQQIEIEGNEFASKEVEKIYDHRVAVVIGINKYNPWPGLEFAVNDAKAIRDKLSEMGYDKIIELYDREATRARIMRILGDELPGTMGRNDSLMVYFAGHGATEDLSGGDQEGYIIPVDGDVKNYRGTAISMTYIHEMIKKYRAKHILFVFDSCYSGLGLKRGGGAAKTPTGYIKAMAQKRVTQIFTAGGKDEQAAEEKGHGVFTRALLDALDGKDGLSEDGYILASDIGRTVRKKVGEKTNFRQTPLFGYLAGEGDFIFEIE